ncbi:hypothetical protein ORF 111R [Red seabream iridovirus]|uniref:2-cysteine adaptor domain-containing protein n=2 Tax=Infectious spleen and kidney necrosis virus TaxID=180170 RepID=A0A3Q9EFW5_ISKNV|nr:2-cysteine adaptor domain-containing protein [Pompano iridovirus]AZQ20917.1 2-cysteine adaptor domain-containing protein [Pompano iridovirus]AZQ21045.1 2-cysteine adaptor domain-containing protein [Pompano iridovirus]WDW25989.1 2-cysteine adaptor domain-containing protein [Megalocytivirus FD201807]BAK14232.1 hypothetical protein ORF 111R [Red seabream iridovirus]
MSSYRCRQLRQQQYRYNPLTGAKANRNSPPMRTARRVCNDLALCSQHTDTYNPWTDRALLPDSPVHDMIDYVCNTRRGELLNDDLQRHWESYETTPYAGGISEDVPDERTRMCNSYRDHPGSNPVRPGERLGRYSGFSNSLYKYCNRGRNAQCDAYFYDDSVDPETGIPLTRTGRNAWDNRCAGMYNRFARSPDLYSDRYFPPYSADAGTQTPFDAGFTGPDNGIVSRPEAGPRVQPGDSVVRNLSFSDTPPAATQPRVAHASTDTSLDADLSAIARDMDAHPNNTPSPLPNTSELTVGREELAPQHSAELFPI